MLSASGRTNRERRPAAAVVPSSGLNGVEIDGGVCDLGRSDRCEATDSFVGVDVGVKAGSGDEWKCEVDMRRTSSWSRVTSVTNTCVWYYRRWWARESVACVGWGDRWSTHDGLVGSAPSACARRRRRVLSCPVVSCRIVSVAYLVAFVRSFVPRSSCRSGVHSGTDGAARESCQAEKGREMDAHEDRHAADETRRSTHTTREKTPTGSVATVSSSLVGFRRSEPSVAIAWR
jgi:hypothetical protein